MKKLYTERQYRTYLNFTDTIDNMNVEEGSSFFMQMQFWFLDNNISDAAIEQMKIRQREEFLGHRPVLTLITKEDSLCYAQ